ncbi:integrase [Micromonospora coerulea]|uniref:integrase n=1 Tax=Micromonospora coerulea TaxID=47856 RepID=UPI0019046530|nr:integrase [Micromonospora veneta]
MDLEDVGRRARFLIRDRDGKFPSLFDAVLDDAGIEVVLSGVRMPRMNAFMERWAQTCRRERLGRTLIWNQRHLLHALRQAQGCGHRLTPSGLVAAVAFKPMAGVSHRLVAHRARPSVPSNLASTLALEQVGRHRPLQAAPLPIGLNLAPTPMGVR